MSKQKKSQIENLSSLKPEAFSFENASCHKDLVGKVNEILKEKTKSKFNSVDPCETGAKECNCNEDFEGNPKGAQTDLIVLIDTSSSMRSAASEISRAVSKAIDRAKEKCEPDLKVTYLGVDGTWPGTVFTQNHKDHIIGLQGSGVVLAGDAPPLGLRSEQGANAIEDLSQYADWREGSCRAIFFIGDTELDSSTPLLDFANETAATNSAISAANGNNVTVFAHHIIGEGQAPEILQNYTDLCEKTGGEFFISPTADETQYINLLSDVICNSCGKPVCTEVQLSKLEPCISIQWGDSQCDCIESTDYEVMSITVCNCYSNVQFNNFTIAMMEVLDQSGRQVPLLPNGKPSVQVVPIGVHCFGDIGPCACVTREFVLINEGAKEGKYKINLQGICFDVSIPIASNSSCFEFSICKD